MVPEFMFQQVMDAPLGVHQTSDGTIARLFLLSEDCKGSFMITNRGFGMVWCYYGMVCLRKDSTLHNVFTFDENSSCE